MHFYQSSSDEVLRRLGSSSSGLSAAEVQRRQKRYGLNIIKVQSEPLWRIILEPFLDIFMLVLLIAAIISLWHGEAIDAIIIFVIAAISAVIFYIQRFSTDRVLRSLSRHDAQKVDVHRVNRTTRVDASQLVPGDVVSLAEGEKVPADIRLIRSTNLRVDEAQLTGESLPISKQTDALTGTKEMYEQTNMLFQGSFVVSGTSTGVVVATGNQTEFGNLAMLSKRESTQSPVQRKIDTLITRVIAAVSAIALVAFGLSLLRGMDVLESLRFVMALAVSAVPESLPIAISVVLVLGMRRMAAKKALVHQMRAIETIGVITTIATDKTGTLTKNKLTVQQTWTPDEATENIDRIIGLAVNRAHAKSHDPLDIALNEYARKQSASPRHAPVRDLPFSQAHAMSATIWHHGRQFRLYVKGAPEAILAACRVSARTKKRAQQMLDEMTARGYRVIGLAMGELDEAIAGFDQLGKQRLTFAGFVAVADVLRPEAPRAIRAALKAGVSVRMITGDHFETAYQIGRELGMVEDRDEVFDCRNMAKLSDDQLDAIVTKTKVFSRVIPEQKYRLLTILKKHHITAMTGDGVNDVPALTNAHVGVAMGSGSHIAKDAGDIILLNDNFKTIIDAMREGRTIIANIRRMLFYLLSTNTGELITMLGALLIGIKTPLEPVQILWVNLVTDTSMVIPLGLEPGEKQAMNRSPENPDAPILSHQMIWRMVIVAGTMSAIALAVYIFFEQRQGHAYAQTMAFIALVVSQWANAFNARSDDESLLKRLKVMNKSFYAGMSLSIVLQILVFFGPLGEILHIAHVALSDMIVISLISFIIPIVISEWHKYVARKR
ncbi:cation-translocating P-type ATPase [Candidatus Nanosynbacter lyticus]|uniref:cation-translocating P-type ATPase n=1 Tax=Candidatus Nanosynbacter lyticus TaxID=2093824 RepID=UPI0025571B8F|nr:cation-transporting P-type ATPase [Candidatus Nanosynbacter lyticus]WLD46685.1 cation-transporting P-type ATPase [Candidatus Nanosynbacter lyticus]